MKMGKKRILSLLLVFILIVQGFSYSSTTVVAQKQEETTLEEGQKEKTAPGEEQKEETAPGEEQKEETAPGEEQKEETAPEEEQKKETAPEEEQKEETAPEEEQKEETAPEEEQKEETTPEEEQKEETAPKEKQKKETVQEVEILANEQEVPQVGNEELEAQAVSNLSLSYNVYLNGSGWSGYKAEGQTAGSTSKSNTTNRMESIAIKLNNKTGISGSIRYRTHITAGIWDDSNNYLLGGNTGGGWSAYVNNDVKSGTAGSKKHLEAVTLEFTGDLSNYYYIDYSAFTMKSPSNVTPIAPSSLRYDWTGVIDKKFLENNPNWDPGPYDTSKNFAGTFMYTLPISGFKAVIQPRMIQYTVDANGGRWNNQAGGTGFMSVNETKKIADPTREGHTFDGWTVSHQNPPEDLNGFQKVNKNINGSFNATTKIYTAANRNVIFVAKWKPNTLTIKYNANGGTVDTSKATYDINSYTNNWNFNTSPKNLVNFSSFGLSRTGYHRNVESWNTKADGTGNGFDQDTNYEMIRFANNLLTGSRTVTMYARWNPNKYTVIPNLNEGSGNYNVIDAVYDTAFNMWKDAPKRTGYVFAGWKSDSNGAIYGAGTSLKNLTTRNNATIVMTAQWTPIQYIVKADLAGGTGTFNDIKATYDKTSNLWPTAPTRTGYSFINWESSLNGQKYAIKASFVNLTSINNTTITMKAKWEENKYIVKYDPNSGTGKMENSDFKYDQAKNLRKNLFEKTYYEFTGWNTKADGNGTGYKDEQSVKNLTAKNGDVVTLYAQWEKKLFNVAYSGNEQTSGTNMLELNIWQGDNYIFRANVFEKIEKEIRKTISGTEYEVDQKYGFMGWVLDTRKSDGDDMLYKSNETQQSLSFYKDANQFNAISNKVSEDNKPYDEVKPLVISRNLFDTFSSTPAKEYINVKAKWNAYPVIVVEPKDPTDPEDPENPDPEDDEPRIENNILYFYEGEEPVKKNLLAHLTVTDKEDGNIITKVKIKKIVYSDGAKKQGYTKEWEEDIPNDYVFDTFYLEMEKDEVITHIVTYEVTDSVGNTTTAELPVKVKYNNFPEIKAPKEYYYFKKDINSGLITDKELIENAEVTDIEDKDKIKDKLELLDFDLSDLKMQTESKIEVPVIYTVTDAFRKTTTLEVKIIVVDPDALQGEEEIKYVRFISDKYLNTLENTSKWKEGEYNSYLQTVLGNETAIFTWNFEHENVKAVKDWITAGSGNWKRGQAANQEFLNKFSGCKQ